MYFSNYIRIPIQQHDTDMTTYCDMTAWLSRVRSCRAKLMEKRNGIRPVIRDNNMGLFAKRYGKIYFNIFVIH